MAMAMDGWGFYGRREELSEIERLLKRHKFFFCAISGRRRIGKTTLIHEALRRQGGQRQALYVQIPDSDERGVIQVFEDAVEDTLQDQDFARDVCQSFSDIALTLRVMWERGAIIAIDEFQYFHRAALSDFLSHLQREIDRSRAAQQVSGGVFVLGSIHTEMTAVLEDMSSPLFNRVTDRIRIFHWDFETLFEMLRAHGITDPSHWLFLWSMFEGVPKFYRDCFDHEVLCPGEGHRTNTLKRMFFEGSSPLKDEAENWFLRELRGRYDSVLKLIARTGPCSYGTLKAEYDRTGPGGERQLGGYLKILIERYQMIERVNPIFSKDRERKARYQITDNFLASWLSAIVRNVHFARIRPVGEAVERADEALKVHEGFAFEKMIRLLMEECSRKQRGDFKLTHMVRGYWNKADGSDIEVDIVAINEMDKIIRLGSCKRSERAHDMGSLRQFDGHIARFMSTPLGRKYADWEIQKALYSPQFSNDSRKHLAENGYICVDLPQFEEWLLGKQLPLFAGVAES